MRPPKKQEPSRSPFDVARSFFSSSRGEPPALEPKDVKADEQTLDRLASLHLAVAERLAPLAADPSSAPGAAEAFLGAAREARACALARHQITGGGLGGGISGGGVTVRIEHGGYKPADDFDEMIATNADVAVPTGRPAS